MIDTVQSNAAIVHPNHRLGATLTVACGVCVCVCVRACVRNIHIQGKQKIAESQTREVHVKGIEQKTTIGTGFVLSQ